MNKYWLLAKIRRAKPYTKIQKATQEHRTCSNILNREFRWLKAFTKYWTDISYLHFNWKRAYISILKDYWIRKWNCLDNAPTESFFWHMKDEIDLKSIKTFKELEILINNYIFYYNNDRFQWNKKKMTPVNYRNHLLK